MDIVEKSVAWTEEDEAIRILAREKRIADAKQTAKNGVIGAKRRVRESKKKEWFYNQSIDIQNSILRKEAARKRTIEHTEYQLRCIAAALFHTWNVEQFELWMYDAMKRDLHKQFKSKITSQKLSNSNKMPDTKRSLLTIGVIQKAYHELCAVIAQDKLDVIINSIDQSPNEQDFMTEINLMNGSIISGKELSLAGYSLNKSTGMQEDLTQTSESSINMKKLAEMEPIFEIMSKLLAVKLSHVSSCRDLLKEVDYASRFAVVKLESDEVSQSLNIVQHAYKKRLIEVDVLERTYKQLHEVIHWIAIKLQFDAANDWMIHARRWVCHVVFEGLDKSRDAVLRGEHFAASKIAALYHGSKVRKLVKHVWELADLELQRELEVERVQAALARGTLHFSDVVDSVLLEPMPSSVTAEDTTHSHSTLPRFEFQIEKDIPLTVHKLVPFQTGIKISLSKLLDADENKALIFLRKVGICVGYVLQNPATNTDASPFSVDPLLLAAAQSGRNIAWTKSAENVSTNSPGKVMLLLVDSRKDWNFPFGTPCGVDVTWNDPLSQMRSDAYCELVISGLLPFSAYEVVLNIDMEPWGVSGMTATLTADEGMSTTESKRVYSFKHDVVQLLSTIILTSKSVPSAPRCLEANAYYLDDKSGSVDEVASTKRLGVRISWNAAPANGSIILKYEIQRLVIMASPLHEEASVEINVWKPLAATNLQSTSFVDWSLLDPFVAQYRIRAMSNLGASPFATSLEVSSADCMNTSANTSGSGDGRVMTEYADPLGLVSVSAKDGSELSPIKTSSNTAAEVRNQRNTTNEIDRILNAIVSGEGLQPNARSFIDADWLSRLTEACPFENK